MDVRERAALLMRLMQPTKPGNPTPNARQAQRILNSLQANPAKINPTGGHIRIENPVTGVNFNAQNRRGTYDVGFSTRTGLNRPDIPLRPVEQLGVKATIYQGLDSIPYARGNKTGRPSTYQFEPITDEYNRENRRPTNQRGLAYKRLTRGAFTSHPHPKGFLTDVGYGERITQDKWQPRDAKGRFGKYVQFNPVTQGNVLGRLGSYAAQRLAPRAMNPGIGVIMTSEDILMGLFGTNLQQLTKEATEKGLKEGTVQRPATLMMPF
jgi:hypothetical protein